MHRGKSKLPRLERPTAYTQLDHKTVSIGGIAQIQHIAIANIDRRRRQNIDPKSPDAIYGVTRSKGRVWRARSSKYQDGVVVKTGRSADPAKFPVEET